jgi:deazaflavin-dependent oxidoreductase (nitroreductase family)
MTTQNSHTISSKSSPEFQNKHKAPALMIPLMKMPLIFYRIGLGWMLGKRFMQLTHSGRISGKTYHTVLAVLQFDEKSREIWVVCPWNESNWYHNIQKKPAMEVQIGMVRFKPEQRTLSSEEIAAVFIEFRHNHPIFSRIVARIPGWDIESSYDEFLVLAQSLHGFVFKPQLIL